MGRSMERAMGDRAYKTRQLSHWAFFFRAAGSEIDHLYGEYGTKAFLVELTRSGLNPWKKKGLGTYFRWYNPKNAERHRKRGVAAVLGLLRHPELPSERAWREAGRDRPIPPDTPLRSEVVRPLDAGTSDH